MADGNVFKLMFVVEYIYKKKKSADSGDNTELAVVVVCEFSGNSLYEKSQYDSTN